ncbi:ATPase family associated with various cellular activities (AAA) [Collimonas sp. OK607]|uniref:ATP-binding protein n=1 Tax=Collimonas sp. OK607 TaxID=1798194 RepID=UPI0008E40BEE|nr:ATP-binding protein [Collimonas sp. OK607]SFA98794.1 ATPase family associated with various cellular activities (AAA) [Collimonas sp. OK607]
MNALTANAKSLEREIAWFSEVLTARFHDYFMHEGGPYEIERHQPPDVSGDPSTFAGAICEYGMSFDERMVLILTLLPHIRPQALDLLFTANKNTDRSYTEFGGRKGKNHAGLLPTCETAVFILAGDDLVRRFEVLKLFDADHFFARQSILKLEQRVDGEPFLSAALSVESDFLDRCTSGLQHKPDYSAGFPAKRIMTQLDWSDLVLAPEVLEEIEHIKIWLKGGAAVMQRWDLDKSVKPGFRSLFYGPPGTGKTLTATLLGKAAEVDVYRIDLSKIVSKYIGETEKNMANVFDQAQNKNWILFFDEADALFGKRTEGSSSNDRHANQEIAYLLQRIEDFPGVVILASNLRSNIDDAFARRFQSAIYFPIPDGLQRLRLWQNIFPQRRHLADDVNLENLAEENILSGGALLNVVRYAAMRAERQGRDKVCKDDLLRGVKKEFIKEGRTI